MASVGDEESPATAAALAQAQGPSSVATDATPHAQGDAGNITNDTNATRDNSPAPVSTTASASATASPSPTPTADASDLPPLIVSDIAPPAAVSIPPRPGVPPAGPTPSTSVASPASTVNGLGSRPGRTSMSNTPHQSPALPSPPVPLRAAPAVGRPPPAATQPPPPVTVNTKASKYQNNPVWRAGEYQKPQISPVPVPIPPPAPSRPSLAAVQTVSFPSPGREQVHSDPKFLDDKTRITFGIQQAIPEAVRRSVRDNWEKCLLGSDFHQAFVLNASIHHATPAAIQRGIRDFGRAMIMSAKAQIVEVMTPADIDAVAAQILSKASNSFLDAALELRLKSIDAKRLINALARAERLGYEPSDVVDEEDDPAAVEPPTNHHQHAVPAPAPPHQPRAQPTPPPPRNRLAPQPASQPAASSGPLMYCNLCFRKFVYKSAYEHHVEKKVCTRSPVAPGGYKFSCQHCGQGFTTIMGVQYHNANNICGEYKDPFRPAPAPAASTPATPRTANPAPKTPASAPTHIPTPTQTPGSAQPASQPSSSGGPRIGTPGLHASNGAVADPYAHLSPEQLAAMQEELRLAELSYGERFKQANAIPDASERKTRLDGLSNSFGTKQSLIRKKYGVRLRMRRTKAEIQAERDRMQYRTAAELAADSGIPSPNLGRPGRPIASTPSRPPTIIARSSNGGTGPTWASVNRPGGPAGGPAPQALMGAPASASPVPASSVGGPGAMDVSMHAGSKRRYSGSSGSSESKRMAYSEMGGLSGGAAAHAETMDPTLPLVPGVRTASTVSAKGLGTADEPMALDDSDSESEDSGDDDEDIPAELPPSVRQSLQQASPSVTPGPQSGSRPSSGPRPGGAE